MGIRRFSPFPFRAGVCDAAVPRSLRKASRMLQSLIRLISRLFGLKDRGEQVSLNPKPLPPDPGEDIALNPQPLPPEPPEEDGLGLE